LDGKNCGLKLRSITSRNSVLELRFDSRHTVIPFGDSKVITIKSY
jgi:hypothetical protein